MHAVVGLRECEDEVHVQRLKEPCGDAVDRAESVVGDSISPAGPVVPLPPLGFVACLLSLFLSGERSVGARAVPVRGGLAGLSDDAIGRGCFRPELQQVEVDRLVACQRVLGMALVHAAGAVPDSVVAGWQLEQVLVLERVESDVFRSRGERDLDSVLPEVAEWGFRRVQFHGEADVTRVQAGDEVEQAGNSGAAQPIFLAPALVPDLPLPSGSVVDVDEPVVDPNFTREQDLRNHRRPQCGASGG